MAAKTLGALIKEARTAAGFTQAKLADEVGLSANDISKAERDLAVPSNEDLKKIAKATGVTQKSLLDAAKAAAGKTSGSGKTSSSGKTGSSGKTSGSGKTGSSGKTSGSGKTGSSGKTSTASKSSMQVTATERRLVELYRKADSETKKSAMKVLRGTANTTEDVFTDLIGNVTSSGASGLSGILGGDSGSTSGASFTDILSTAFNMLSGTREMPADGEELPADTEKDPGNGETSQE